MGSLMSTVSGGDSRENDVTEAGAAELCCAINNPLFDMLDRIYSAHVRTCVDPLLE